MEYNKLVRDKIPEIIKNNGDEPVTHIAVGTEYEDALYAKLVEEVDEYLESKDTEELGDILEVLYAIGELHGLSKEDLEAIRARKVSGRGGFSERIILDRTN